MIQVQDGAMVDVELPGSEPVVGTVLETSTYGICIRYTDRHDPARTWTHWFHQTGRRMGANDATPVRFVDRFGAAVTTP
jgi:hypothetical protein